VTRYVLSDDDGPDVAFNGDLVAQVDSRDGKTQHGEWTVIRVYRRAAGGYAVQRERWSEDGDGASLDDTQARAFDTEAALVESLGWSWFTKGLYERCGFSTTLEL
jgi:hypothetical protein